MTLVTKCNKNLCLGAMAVHNVVKELPGKLSVNFQWECLGTALPNLFLAVGTTLPGLYLPRDARRYFCLCLKNTAPLIFTVNTP